MRERLLVADLEELRGDEKGELSRHLDRCPSCAALAQRVLEGHGALDRSLDHLKSSHAVEAALERIRSTPRPRRSRRAWRWVAPAAVAAALATLLLLRPSPFQPVSTEAWVPALADSWSDLGGVESATSRTIMVFETEDRSAKVIWFSGKEE